MQFLPAGGAGRGIPAPPRRRLSRDECSRRRGRSGETRRQDPGRVNSRARKSASAILVVFVITFAASFRTDAQAPAARVPGQLPDGPGKATFESVCSLCHSPNAPAGKQWTRELWEAKVIEMLQEEPEVTADERRQIVEYLTATFKPGGRIYINLAGASDLAQLLDLPLAEAERIVRHRAEKGPFANVEALKSVDGIIVAKIDAKARELEF